MVMRDTSVGDTFGKVAVLMGGDSSERDISLNSGHAVLRALHEQHIDAHKIDVNNSVIDKLIAGNFDRAFIALHGRGGEDGQTQGLLESLRIPYTGSGIIGAVLSINKVLTKQLWLQQGLPTPPFIQVSTDDNVETILEKAGLPLIIKPVNEGSSIGMTKVISACDITDAVLLATRFDTEVIAESWVEGEEYTVAIVGQKALPVIRLKTPNSFYDFVAKYQADTTEYLCPCGLTKEEEQQCQQLALQAFNGLRMTGWGRIDLMRDRSGQFYLLEANSVPGMTSHSLVPIAAEYARISFNQLVWQILATSMES